MADNLIPKDDPLAFIARAYAIAEARRHSRGDEPDRCINCRRDMTDVPPLAPCPSCGAEN